tara:strand:- start:973 stop:1302 length:330 start_codon:yes stop_codon:yes gene_type:complete
MQSQFTVELSDKHKIKRVYVKSIDNYSSKSLAPIFEEHISTTAQIITDKWRGYEPLKKSYNIEQKLSDEGKNFKELHVVIMQLKSWLGLYQHIPENGTYRLTFTCFVLE